jgi:uncharacterized protein (UPF0261 family)
MARVVLVGTLDTKGTEYAYLRDRIRELGHEVLLIDAGVLGSPTIGADIDREAVATAAGTTIAALRAAGDRGAAVTAMSEGVTRLVVELERSGRLDAIAGMGGSGGTSLITQAMRALPIGVPKLVVSTVAASDTRGFIGASDITLMHSVVDIAGLNRVSERILGNAAAAIAGMAGAYAGRSRQQSGKPIIAATMFGVTTPCVTTARAYFEARGYEVMVFHAVGTGGRAMEALTAAGLIAGVFDATTTELADELVGGIFGAGAERLTVAGAHNVPQVVSLGALDMVNFGAMGSVPERFRHRHLHAHNSDITLMRTTAEECRRLGEEIGRKLSGASPGKTVLFIPLKGVSAMAVEGGPFYDPEADRALVEGIDSTLSPAIERHELALDINDPAFAEAMAARLLELIETVRIPAPNQRT